MPLRRSKSETPRYARTDKSSVAGRGAPAFVFQAGVAALLALLDGSRLLSCIIVLPGLIRGESTCHREMTHLEPRH